MKALRRERERFWERERKILRERESFRVWDRKQKVRKDEIVRTPSNGLSNNFFQNKLIQIYHDSRHRGSRDGVSKTMSYFKKKLLRAKIDLPGSEDVQKRFWILKNMPLFGCRHSSVDSSASTILLPRVRVPSTPSMLLSF